jgi:hypothetical protein
MPKGRSAILIAGISDALDFATHANLSSLPFPHRVAVRAILILIVAAVAWDKRTQQIERE